MNKLLPLTIFVAIAGVGCSAIKNNPIYGDSGVIRDRSQDYESSLVGKKLEVPSGFDVKDLPAKLVIPDIGQTATQRVVGAFEVPRPEFFYADSTTESVNFTREGADKLIVVDESVSNVWVKVQEFWRFNGVEISSVTPSSGVMETAWIRRQGPEYSLVDRWIKRLTLQDVKGDTQDKLRVTISPYQGDFNRSAIKLTHAQYPVSQQVPEVDWDKATQNVSYKSDMMFEMLRYLSKATGNRDTTSLVALQEKTTVGHQLGRDSRGSPVLKLDGLADQAWNAVSSAVERSDIDVGTRDQKKGVFYVTYTTTTPFEATQEMGFFEWLHSDRDELTISTDFLSGALGVEADDENAIRYSSRTKADADLKLASDQEALEQRNAVAEIPESDDPLANAKGFKLWLGGKVIYVFGDSDANGTYNETTGSYEHVGEYQLRLKRQREGVFLHVLTPQGLSAANIVAEEILWAIKDKLHRIK